MKSPAERFAEIFKRKIYDFEHDSGLALKHSLYKFFDEIIPELEKKIEGLTQSSLLGAEDNGELYSMIHNGKLKCCPNCHTVVEDTIKIPQSKYSELLLVTGAHNSEFIFVERCKHCIEKPKEEPFYISSLEKDYQCPDCGETYRGGHMCKKEKEEELKPKCDNCGKEIGAIAITRAGFQPHEVYCTEKCLQEKASKVTKKIIKELKSECEHDWTAIHSTPYRICNKCNRRQELMSKWEDVK